jgi:hypothetical protein
MSTALAVPLPQSRWSIGQQWIAAHIAAQLICFATAGAAYGIASLIGANDPAAGPALLKAALGLAVVTEVIFALASATLRGRVLRQVFPAFPMQLWVFVVAGYILLFGALSGFSGTAAAPRSAPQFSAGFLLSGLAIISIAGAMMGLVVGTLEALVLRRAAQGAAYWVIWSAVAWSAGIALIFLAGGVMLTVGGLSPVTLVVLGAATKLLAGAVFGVLTLPALKHMQPR